MTMTYDGTMVMPKNFVVVTEDEMTYVDGGASWSGKRFVRNLAGLVTIVAGVGYILDKACPNWHLLAVYGFATVCGKLSGVMLSIGIKVATVNAVAAGILLVGGVAAVYGLGKVDVF